MQYYICERYDMRNQIDTNKALMELDAIDAVRVELANAKKRGADQNEMGEIHGRLMSLYAAQDISNIKSVIQKIDYKKVA
jgi:hypothetical protein